MKTVIRGALLCLALSLPAFADTTDKSGTITLGGTAQNAIAANSLRTGWCIQNPAAASEKLYVRVGGTASATTGVELAAGAQACNAVTQRDQGPVSVFGATSTHAYLGFETQ